MNPRRMPSAHARGFTLIELMLAVAVMALVLGMLASSFSAVAHSKVHGEARLAVDREGRGVLWQLSTDLRGAVQTTSAPSNVMLQGTARSGANGPADVVTISTFAPGHRLALTGLGPENLVSYNLIANSEQRGWYLLERSQQSGLAGGGLTAPSAAILADNVLSLYLRYLDGYTGDWRSDWDSTSLAPISQTAKSQIPAAVDIELRMAAPNGHEMDLATQVTMPMGPTTTPQGTMTTPRGPIW